MRTPNTQPDYSGLVDEAREIWDRIAEWWDDRIGDGNDFQDFLIEPATESLLGLQPGERVLDIACGAGRFARRMAELGAEVVAFDQSQAFIQRARKRTMENADRITYLVMNAAEGEALMALGEGRFDAAVATMALMDMATIDPLVVSVHRLLKPGGRFVFSVLHPAFNLSTSRLVAEEEEDRDGDLVITYGVRVSNYLESMVRKGVGIPGQPEPHYYFHRPMSLLFNTCFQAGFALDGIEEPALPPGRESQRSISWANLPTIPPVLVARMRRRSS